MTSPYAIPGAVALLEWLLASGLYALGWYRTSYRLNRLGDSLVVGGMFTSLAGIIWLVWDVSPALVLTQSGLGTLLAVFALGIYAALAYRRAERVSALLLTGFAVLAQAYAVRRLWWGIEVDPQATLLSVWLVVRWLAGLLGYGALVVGAVGIAVNSALHRMSSYLSSQQLSARVGLPRLEWESLRVALVALSVALAAELIQSWWAYGKVMRDGWGGVTWLLLTAGVYGLLRGVIPRRPAHVLLAIASAAGVVAALSMGGL